MRDPQFLALARAALERGEAHEAEIVWDGAPKRLLRVRAAPVREAGPGAILLVGDVSTLRRLERMRSDFVANVSHELRTPLAAIAGAAETLADGALSDPEAGPRFVATIARHADRLTALVDDLLTLSRLESTPESIERVPVDFAHVVRQACDAVAARARDAGLSLDVDAEGPVRVLGDPEALRRLVDNLVVNAVTYTPAGGAVRVGLAADEGRAVLTVADTGIGIGPEHLARIFERFYRVDKARSRGKGGTGLGLSIVKHAVNLHGGEIAVESRPGAGSTFTVSIPLADDGGDAPADPAPLPEIRAMSRHFLHALEDLHRDVLLMGGNVEATVARAVRAILERDVPEATAVIEGDREINLQELKIDEECLEDARALPADRARPALRDGRHEDHQRPRARGRPLRQHRRARARARRVRAPGVSCGLRRDRRPVAAHADGVARRARPPRLGEAMDVLRMDDPIDALLRGIFDDLEVAMAKDPKRIRSDLLILSAAKNLERIADHASNIAEDVVYMVDGNIIRHRH